ncbi:hypothetical protein DUI87_10307 [Hirundo rustica rustica]|uniref:Uncharacterized protein n=1 Tax=Hirundo rustica rustica TaxID=333673 RepID=A0A3M0KHT4_HIRRU|nr:hypothetical protein DUI87_10307 [Hirundo rustica rustica]
MNSPNSLSHIFREVGPILLTTSGPSSGLAPTVPCPFAGDTRTEHNTPGPATETERTQDQESVTKDRPAQGSIWKRIQENQEIRATTNQSANQEQGQEIKELALKVMDKRELGLEQDNAVWYVVEDQILSGNFR